jgi:predicted AlkP superfamily pyrophosphatase or phosphodiesterase
MKKNTGILMFFLMMAFALPAQQVKKEPAPGKTRLVVGLVVDQMRNDYLYRYWQRFGNGGFKRLVNGGFYFKNAHFNYIPTYTAPGHASIYTGATPRAHGIIGNDWYSRRSNNMKYCVVDTGVKSVGSKNQTGKSPQNLLSSTIGDELKTTSNKRSKVFAFALKDRSAILPAGHAADGAFWLDDATGEFISSSWYMNDLPRWLKNFNDERYAKAYLEKGWTPLYPIETYTQSLPDDNKYEFSSAKKEKPVFPYSYLQFIESSNFGIIKSTPFGNSFTKDVAVECLKKEQLGKDEEPDLLLLSFSATDIIAHAFGTRAVEVEDMYLRLDKDIEDLLNVLDKEVGRNNYTVFLTADHGGADVPNYLLNEKIPAGYIYEKNIERVVKKYLQQQYGDSTLLANVSNEQVFLHEKKMTELKLSRNEVEEKLAIFLTAIPGISEAYPSNVVKFGSSGENDYQRLLQNGYNHKMSGNVCYIYSPGWLDFAPTGTSHGSPYNYDTHVPILFYGRSVKKGVSYNYTTITQIAPTICELLEINQPNSTVAGPLNSYFK